MLTKSLFTKPSDLTTLRAEREFHQKHTCDEDYCIWEIPVCNKKNGAIVYVQGLLKEKKAVEILSIVEVPETGLLTRRFCDATAGFIKKLITICKQHSLTADKLAHFTKGLEDRTIHIWRLTTLEDLRAVLTDLQTKYPNSGINPQALSQSSESALTPTP